MTAETKPANIQINNGGIFGGFWFAGWLFTIAFTNLIWWQGLLALIVWPYYLGLAVR